MNHKRGRPKKARAGCLLCKPHKSNGADRRTLQERKSDERDREWLPSLKRPNEGW